MGPNAAAIFREYPFLEKLVSKGAVQQARVERIDETLLARELREEAHGDVVMTESIILLDREGATIAYVGQWKLEHPATKFLWWRTPAWTEWRWDPDRVHETVWEAVQRAGASVYYIVTFFQGDLVVHKPPKRFPSVLDWVEEQTRRAHEAIQQDIARIDTEGGDR